MSDITMVRLLGNLVELQKQTLEELKGLRLDMAAEGCKVVETQQTCDVEYIDIGRGGRTYKLSNPEGE